MRPSAIRSVLRRKSRRPLPPANGSTLIPVNVVKYSLRRLDCAWAGNQQRVRRSYIHVVVTNRRELRVLPPQSERRVAGSLTLRFGLLGTTKVEDDLGIFAQHCLERDVRVLGQTRFCQ